MVIRAKQSGDIPRQITSAHTVRAIVAWRRSLIRHSLPAIAQADHPIVLRVGNEIELAVGSWTHWQETVLELLQEDFLTSFHQVDWEAVRSFCEQGKSPKAAIDRALARDY
jgi:hypothetical protein